jgi:hypothetical protein
VRRPSYCPIPLGRSAPLERPSIVNLDVLATLDIRRQAFDHLATEMNGLQCPACSLSSTGPSCRFRRSMPVDNPEPSGARARGATNHGVLPRDTRQVTPPRQDAGVVLPFTDESNRRSTKRGEA